MSNPISVIECPPGTGKTQTILNIIANAIINNKTVAIVSNNNTSTANVLEKLERYGVGFIAAYLGNKENKNKFFAFQNSDYPDIKEWKIENEQLKIVKSNLVDSQKELDRGMIKRLLCYDLNLQELLIIIKTE